MENTTTAELEFGDYTILDARGNESEIKCAISAICSWDWEDVDPEHPDEQPQMERVWKVDEVTVNFGKDNNNEVVNSFIEGAIMSTPELVTVIIETAINQI